jgi:hypothetical protein
MGMARIHEIRIHIEHVSGLSDSLLIYGENPESVEIVASKVDHALCFSPRICSPLGGQIRVGKTVCTYYGSGVKVSGDVAALLRYIVPSRSDAGHDVYFSVRDALDDTEWIRLGDIWRVEIANSC